MPREFQRRLANDGVGTMEKNPEGGIAVEGRGSPFPIVSSTHMPSACRRLGERAPFNPGMPNTRERIAGPER